MINFIIFFTISVFLSPAFATEICFDQRVADHATRVKVNKACLTYTNGVATQLEVTYGYDNDLDDEFTDIYRLEAQKDVQDFFQQPEPTSGKSLDTVIVNVTAVGNFSGAIGRRSLLKIHYKLKHYPNAAEPVLIPFELTGLTPRRVHLTATEPRLANTTVDL